MKSRNLRPPNPLTIHVNQHSPFTSSTSSINSVWSMEGFEDSEDSSDDDDSSVMTSMANEELKAEKVEESLDTPIIIISAA